MLVKQLGQGALQEETGYNFSWKLYWYTTIRCPWRSVLPPLSPITLTVGVQWWGPQSGSLLEKRDLDLLYRGCDTHYSSSTSQFETLKEIPSSLSLSFTSCERGKLI